MKQLRKTKQKQLILGVVQNRCDHPTADTIYLEVRALDEKISRGTVYRNLEQFADEGIILRVKVPGADRYDSRTDYHYHILCRKCGGVCDAPIAYRNEIDNAVSEESGFLIERHRTVFEGLCPSCRQESQ